MEQPCVPARNGHFVARGHAPAASRRVPGVAVPSERCAIIGAVDESTASTDAPGRATITACIIARDEAENLPDCLASVSFCDEVVLVDSGSADATRAIAKAAGARVLQNAWRGFAAQRNVALENATGDWVLEVDADERVSPELRDEIERFLRSPPPRVTLAGLPLREVFLGHPLGPSAKYPKYRHRLLLRGAHRHDERRTVHEGLVPDGPVHPFAGDLMHLVATSWGEALGDAWRYARLEAGQLRAPRTPAAVVKGAILRPAAKLMYRLSIDGGWRDGWAGCVRIAIDCGTDSVVWIRHAAGLRGSEHGESGVAEGQHYGAWKERRGCVRVVAVAGDAGSCARASGWLERAGAAGADTALICAGEPPAAEARVRQLPRFGPIGVIRALDAEEQLRPLDAVVPFGRRARAALAMAPADLRGHMPELTAESDPATARWDESARTGQAA